MSDTEEMVRLMEHSAEKLRVSIDTIRELRSPNTTELLAYTASVAAMAYARGVLQLVAASVAPEARRLAQRLRAEYPTWAEINDAVGMSDGELAAVARFLTGARQGPEKAIAPRIKVRDRARRQTKRGYQMGLDVSHDCWHGAYSAFSRWRDKLARVAGYEIAKVTWADGDTFMNGWDTVLIDWGHITENQLQGDWVETPADPLLVLIAHSDCDGYIRLAQAGPLADRLAELKPMLPDEEAPGHIGHWHTKTQHFIDGLRAAVEAGEDVEFS